jgi:hypothetical protein
MSETPEVPEFEVGDWAMIYHLPSRPSAVAIEGQEGKIIWVSEVPMKPRLKFRYRLIGDGFNILADEDELARINSFGGAP